MNNDNLANQQLLEVIENLIEELKEQIKKNVYSGLPSELIYFIERKVEVIKINTLVYHIYNLLRKYTIELYQDFNSRVAISPTMKIVLGDTEFYKKNMLEFIELLNKKVKKYAATGKGLGNNDDNVIRLKDIDCGSFAKYLIEEKNCFDPEDEKDLIKLFSGEITNRKLNYKSTQNSFGTIFYELVEAEKISFHKKEYLYEWIACSFTYKEKTISSNSMSNFISKKNDSGRVKKDTSKYIDISLFLSPLPTKV